MIDGLDHRADAGRLDVAVDRELRGRGLQVTLGGGAGDPDLPRDALQGQGGEVAEEQDPALGHGQLGERVEGGGDLGVETLHPAPPPGLAPPECARPGQRADVVLTVLEPRDLPPVVPGDDHRVTYRLLRGLEVPGQGVGLDEEAGADVLVERLEAVLVLPVHAFRGPRGSVAPREAPLLAFVG
jgi:hypothetical protein